MFNLTIGGWVLFILALIVIAIIAFVICYYAKSKIIRAITIIVSVVIAVVFLATQQWYYTNTASGLRAKKSEKSNFQNGIRREVTVYDMQGDIVKQYKGKFDIDYDNDRVIFDDENGLRHIIYYPTGTIVIDEIGE
ncbi:MAG: hypothetical protein Q4A54_00580 [Parabacteroides sp.]|nr:hypothetical protein [Parabacteroides sp.]